MSRPHPPTGYSFQPGATVSTERRYKSFDEYKKAVEVHGGQCTPGEHSYSILLSGDKELLLMHQPSANLPTGRDIEFKYLPESNLIRFQNIYKDIVKYQDYDDVEFPDERGLRGNKDWYNTYRAVLRPRHGFVGDYEGLIINPPYPRFAPFSPPKTTRNAALAAGVIIAAGVLVWGLVRRRT